MNYISILKLKKQGINAGVGDQGPGLSKKKIKRKK